MNGWVNRVFVVVLMLTALSLPSCGSGTAKTFTIGVVNLSPTLDPVFVGFKASMEKAGYVEGKKVTYIYKGAAKTLPALDVAIAEVMAAKPALILAISTSAALGAKKATEGTQIPVVFSPVTDPVASGLVKSVSSPGGNLTGVRAGGNIAKELELLRRVAPGVTRLFTLHNPQDDASVQSLAEFRAAAAILNIEPVIVEVRTAEEITAALVAVPNDVNGIFLLGSATLTPSVKDFVNAGLRLKLPVASVSPNCDQGALLSYGHDTQRDGEQAARLAVQILQGTTAGDLPVETADFFLGVNLQTARAIGVEIPTDMLQQAKLIVR